MRVLPWIVVAVSACQPKPDTSTDTDPLVEDDTDVTAPDTDLPDTDDTAAPTGCGDGAPVEVFATSEHGRYLMHALARWFLADGRQGDCLFDATVADRWTCDAPLDGDLTVTVTQNWLRGYAEVVHAGPDGCRDGGEVLDARGALTPAGTHFPEDRQYLYRRYLDDYTCEHSFEMYGQGCYAPAIFCADGNSAVLQTDIMNEGTYDLIDGFLYNALLVEGDVPPLTQWSVVDDTTLRDWNGELWHLDDGDPDMTWVCDPEHQVFDTGPWDSGGDTAAVDTDVVDTDAVDTDIVP
jgi:hypothetical protein